jgi:hypothetical protein
VVSSPERRNRAKALLQISILNHAHFVAKSDRHVQDLLATAECLLKQQDRQPTTVEESCESHVAAAEKVRGSKA